MPKVANVRKLDVAQYWEAFRWLSWLSHFELDYCDMKAMDFVEGRN